MFYFFLLLLQNKKLLYIECSEHNSLISNFHLSPPAVLLLLLLLSRFSRVQLVVTPWTAAYQALPSMGFSRQEYWSGCHCLLRPAVLIPCKCVLLILSDMSPRLLGNFKKVVFFFFTVSCISGLEVRVAWMIRLPLIRKQELWCPV